MSATENETAAPPPGGPGQDGMPGLREAGVGLAVVLLIVILLPDFLAVPLIFCLAITVPALLTVALVSGLSALIHTIFSLTLGLAAVAIGLGTAEAIGETLERAGAILLILFGLASRCSNAAWAKKALGS